MTVIFGSYQVTFDATEALVKKLEELAVEDIEKFFKKLVDEDKIDESKVPDITGTETPVVVTTQDPDITLAPTGARACAEINVSHLQLSSRPRG